MRNPGEGMSEHSLRMLLGAISRLVCRNICRCIAVEAACLEGAITEENRMAEPCCLVSCADKQVENYAGFAGDLQHF